MKIIPILIFAVFCVVGFEAKASSYVVIASGSGSEFAPGDLIEGQKDIVLGKDVELTLINSLGKKISIKGPFKGALDAHLKGPGEGTGSGKTQKVAGVNVDMVQSLARLFKNRVVDTGSLGAFRSVSAGNELSDAWMLDSGRLGHFCYSKTKPIKVWRRPDSSAKMIKVQMEGSNEGGGIHWEANAKSADWPTELPASDGASYLVKSDDNKVRRLILHGMPDDLPTRAHQAAWMADQKCDEQAVLLVVSADVEAFLEDMIKKGDF